MNNKINPCKYYYRYKDNLSLIYSLRYKIKIDY